MYGIIRTNAPLWAENEIFFIFKRAKREEIKLIQRPKNLLVIVICWLLTKKIFLGFICNFLTQIKLRWNVGRQLTLKTGLVLTQEKTILNQGNVGTLEFTQEDHLHSSFSSLSLIERNKRLGFFPWMFFHWPWNSQLYEIDLTKKTFVAISGREE